MTWTLYEEDVEWITPDGVHHTLNWGNKAGGDWRQGGLMPPITLINQDTPDVPGTVIRDVHVDPRPVVLSLMVKGADSIAVRQLLRQMATWFRPGVPGILRTTAPDGIIRDLNCYYKSGLEARETPALTGATYQIIALELLAADPYYYDPTAISQTFTQGGTVAFFPFKFNPFPISSSGILGNFNLSYVGDADAWPTWHIVGPGTNPQLDVTYDDGSQGHLHFTATLAAGDALDVDTRYRVKTVMYTPSGFAAVAHYDWIDTTTAFWSLRTGNNVVVVTMGGTSAASQITVTYKNTWYMP